MRRFKDYQDISQWTFSRVHEETASQRCLSSSKMDPIRKSKYNVEEVQERQLLEYSWGQLEASTLGEGARVTTMWELNREQAYTLNPFFSTANEEAKTLWSPNWSEILNNERDDVCSSRSRNCYRLYKLKELICRSDLYGR